MRVIVAGGGVGGLTAALALARAGARVTVLERAAAFSEIGAGLQLSPNATRLLFAMGLEAELRRIGFQPEAAEVRDRADGRLLLATPLGAEAEARWGAPYLQAHRADLLDVLLAATTAAGVALRPGRPVESVSNLKTGVRVQTAGEALDADVLVGADGVRSHVRAALFAETPARFTGQIAWRALVEASRLPAGLIAPAATVWTGPGAHVVHYFVRGGRWVNLVGFTAGRHAGAESWTQAAEPGEIARAFQGWPEPVTRLIAAQTGTGWRSAVHDRPPRPDWARGRVVLLGDAAHPMPPYLAQGAGMAVEDAEALARRLAGAGEPDRALAAYAAERFPRVRRVQAWAQRNGRVFHLPTPLRRAAFSVARVASVGDLEWLYGYRPHA